MQHIDFANNYVTQSPEEVVCYLALLDYATGKSVIKRATNLVFEASDVIYETPSTNTVFMGLAVHGDGAKIFVNEQGECRLNSRSE